MAVAAQVATRIAEKVEGVDAECLAPFVMRTGADVWGLRGTTAASLGRSVRAILLATYPDTAKNLSKLGIACELYCFYALATLFSAASLPAEEHLRLLDIFLFERSPKVLVRAAVAFWGEAHEALMRLQGGDDLPEIWSKYAWAFHCGEGERVSVLDSALQLKVTRRMLASQP